VRKKLGDEIEKNKSFGRELGVENSQKLHAERALLKRENELLKEQEEGSPLKLIYANNGRIQTKY
jgi:hypothetical protein